MELIKLEGLAIMDRNTDRKSALLMGMNESKPRRCPLVFVLQSGC